MSDLPDGISDGKCPTCSNTLERFSGVFPDPSGFGPRVAFINSPPRLREGWWCPACGEYGTETMLEAVAGGLSGEDVEEIQDENDNRRAALEAINAASRLGEDNLLEQLARINAIAVKGEVAEYDPNEEILPSEVEPRSARERAEERWSSTEKGDE